MTFRGALRITLAMSDQRSIREDPERDSTAEEAEAWARRERRRREEWLAGPTDEEKLAWARRHRRRMAREELFDDLEVEDPELARSARQFTRMARLGSRGLLYWGLNWPFLVMEKVLRSGLDWEDEMLRSRRRRVVLDDDE